MLDGGNDLGAQLISAMPDMVLHLDLQGTILDINRAGLQISGYERSEILGHNILDLISPEDRERAASNAVLMLEQSLGPQEYRMVMKDGRTVPFEVNGDLVRDGQGKPMGMVHICRDITARVKAVEPLREVEQLFKSIVQNSHDGIILIDDNYRIVYANDEFHMIMAYEPGEMIGMDFRDFLAPEMYQVVVDRYRMRQAGKTPPIRYEFLVNRKNGEKRWIETSSAVIVNARNQKQTVAQMIDVTQRKLAEEALRESEKRLETILNTTPDPVVVYDNQERVTYINPAFTRVFGWQLDELLGKPIPFVPEEKKPASAEALRELYAHGGPLTFHTKRLTKSGKTLSVVISAAGIVDDNGEISGIVVDLTDVTHTEKLESQLRQAQKMEAIGTLASGVAHDFNNLLQAISGFVELMEARDGKSSAPTGHASQILAAVDRAAELVRRLMVFSRKSEVKLSPIDLNQEINQAVKLLSRIIPKMVRIQTDLDQDIWPILGDSTQIEQVLMNLGSNARDAMPQGGTLTIATRNFVMDDSFMDLHFSAEPGNYIQLSLSDTGLGMDKETSQRIFEPFFTTKKLGEGTGLGLSTVYGVVTGLGGYISCYSEPGEGTVFNIYLPALAQEDQEGRSADSEPSLASLRGTEQILLADDEPAIRRSVSGRLRDFGYRVETAASGEEALAFYQAHPRQVDVVVMDLGMPGMGGNQALKEIMALDPGAKVIVASGYSDHDRLGDLKASGAAGYIVKPFKAADLLKTVRQLLDQPRDS